MLLWIKWDHRWDFHLPSTQDHSGPLFTFPHTYLLNTNCTEGTNELQKIPRQGMSWVGFKDTPSLWWSDTGEVWATSLDPQCPADFMVPMELWSEWAELYKLPTPLHCEPWAPPLPMQCCFDCPQTWIPTPWLLGNNKRWRALKFQSLCRSWPSKVVPVQLVEGGRGWGAKWELGSILSKLYRAVHNLCLPPSEQEGSHTCSRKLTADSKSMLSILDT